MSQAGVKKKKKKYCNKKGRGKIEKKKKKWKKDISFQQKMSWPGESQQLKVT